MLRTVVPDLAERVTFTCGPAPYMAAVRRILGELGYDMARYHEESFTFDDLTEPRGRRLPEGVEYDDDRGRAAARPSRGR